MTRWYEIAIPVPPSLVDEAAALLDVAGFGGVEVRERADGTDVVVVVEVSSEEELAEHTTRAREAVTILDGGSPKTTELDPNVWKENWKQHFSRRTFADRIEVRPPWEDPPPASSHLLSIVINPGMAFGTGLHETTASCLELLVETVRPGMRVADVGCGSGILAIAAARLGAGHVLATDVDPLAVDATRENASVNAVGHVVEVELEPGEIGIPEWESDARPGLSGAREAIHGDTHSRVAGAASNDAPRATSNNAVGGGFAERGPQAFDLVVANILAETLVEMRTSLTGAVRAGGVLLLSGIEARRLKNVEEAFIRPPWTLVRTVVRGDWVSLSLHSDLAEPGNRPSVPSGARKKVDPTGVA